MLTATGHATNAHGRTESDPALKLKITPRTVLMLLPGVALGSIGAGCVALWGWAWAAIVIGGMLWVDLFVMGREQARTRTRNEVEQ